MTPGGSYPQGWCGWKGHEELRHFLPLRSDSGPRAARRHSRLCVLGLVLPATAAAVDDDTDEDEGCSQAPRDARVQGHVHGGCERQSRELHRPTAALSPGLGGRRATGRDAAGRAQPSSRPRECGRLLGTLRRGHGLVDRGPGRSRDYWPGQRMCGHHSLGCPGSSEVLSCPPCRL